MKREDTTSQGTLRILSANVDHESQCNGNTPSAFSRSFSLPSNIMTLSASPIIDKVTAKYTIIGFSIALGISALTALGLLSSVISECPKWDWRLLMSRSVYHEVSWPKYLGQRRLLLLLTAAVLYLIESISNIVYFSSLSTYNDANSLALYIIRLFTITLAGPALCIATAYRIALIIDLQPSTRKRFARGTELMALLVTIVIEIMAIVGIAENARRLDTAGWQTVTIYHSWSAGFIIALPLLCIGSSIFSLRFIWTTTKLDGSRPDTMPAAQAADLNGSGSSPPVADSPSSTAERSVTIVVPTSPQQQLTHTQRLLKPILSVLTVLMAIYWLLFLGTFAIGQPFKVPIRGNAVSTLVTACATATEASFGYLLKWRKRTEFMARTRARSGGAAGGGSPPAYYKAVMNVANDTRNNPGALEQSV